jgi:hypothetical protein
MDAVRVNSRPTVGSVLLTVGTLVLASCGDAPASSDGMASSPLPAASAARPNSFAVVVDGGAGTSDQIFIVDGSSGATAYALKTGAGTQVALDTSRIYVVSVRDEDASLVASDRSTGAKVAEKTVPSPYSYTTGLGPRSLYLVSDGSESFLIYFHFIRAPAPEPDEDVLRNQLAVALIDAKTLEPIDEYDPECGDAQPLGVMADGHFSVICYDDGQVTALVATTEGFTLEGQRPAPESILPTPGVTESTRSRGVVAELSNGVYLQAFHPQSTDTGVEDGETLVEAWTLSDDAGHELARLELEAWPTVAWDDSTNTIVVVGSSGQALVGLDGMSLDVLWDLKLDIIGNVRQVVPEAG